MKQALAATALAGLVALAASSAPADIDLWPLFESGEDELTILYPFFVREGKFRMYFPLYYRTNEGRDRHLVWPLVKIADGRLERVAPLWFSRAEGDFTFVPFIHQDERVRVTLIPPMYTRRDGSLDALLPIYARTPTDLYVLPGYYRLRRAGEPKEDGVYGLFGRSRSPEEEVTHALLRGYYSRTGEEGSLLGIGYLFWRGEERDDAFTLLAPLYYRREAGDERELLVLSYYQKRSPTSRRTDMFPIWGRKRSANADLDYFFLFYIRSVHRGTQERRNLSMLWPLYERFEVAEQDGTISERRRRFAIFTDHRKPDGSREFSILGLPIMERTSDATGSAKDPPR